MVIDRSADAPTIVVAESVSFDGSGSGETAETAAVFESVAGWLGAVTATVMSGAAPTASAGRVHVTDTLPAWEHAHPDPEAETNATPAGKVSTTDTVSAAAGPWFVTDSV